jgi:ABC superfamily ATP binding cassette transporter, ABC protein
LGESDTSNTEVKNKIGVVFDDLFVPEELSLKNLEKFCSMVYDEWDREAFFQYAAKFKLPEKQLIKSYSRGMRMKLSISMALSHNAELLLLDEATSGLDPIVRDEILDMLMDFMQDENHSILISSHILSDLEKIADYIAFINDGKILFMEEKDRLEDDYAICMLSNEEMQNIDQRAIIGKRVNSFGVEVLAKRAMLPNSLNMKKPSIEEIMLYFVKGGER